MTDPFRHGGAGPDPHGLRPAVQGKRPLKRRRARALGIEIGRYRPGRHNAITDVVGVRVGHHTLISGDGPLVPGAGPVRTGVTVILPNDGDIFNERVPGSGFVLNGAGEVSGLTQLMEWGLLETPIALTNTMSVGAVSDGVVRHMIDKHPGIGGLHDVLIPIVGECDDSWLNDAAGRHLRPEHVAAAVAAASGGRVEEGSVGGGTGMVTCDFKAGIGTSSRRLPDDEGGWTVGVLVMSNFGIADDLRVDGLPVGRLLGDSYPQIERRRQNYGSIIVVVATDAPLLAQQIGRLCKRAALGIGRVGSVAHHGSGEIIVGFSTANRVPRVSDKRFLRLKVLLDSNIDPLYAAAVEATEEAIINALCVAEPMTGRDGHHAPALPLRALAELVRRRDTPQA